MSDTNTHTTETTTERKPPTIADIVREKTDDGRLIIDFFTDVMTGRIDGAELCHRIDAAKQLEKHKSKDAAEFIAKYKGVPCGHSINGRPNPADPCTAEDRSLVAVTLNAPATLTRDFLTVLSGIDEFLMARLIRAQTADGVTVIEFLDDVMQDRTDGFKTHHRIAAAKELIVHILRDEQPEPLPAEPPSSVRGEPRQIVVPAEAETQGDGGGRSAAANPARTEPSSPVVPAEAGTQGSGGGRSTVANPARTEPVEGPELVAGSVHPEPREIVVPAQAGTQGSGGGRSTPANPARTEPVEGSVRAEPVLSTAEGSAHPEPVEGPCPEFTERPADSSSVVPAMEPAEKPAPVELTPAERRIKEKLEQHWHEPDPWAAPIDSTHPGRSPPW